MEAIAQLHQAERLWHGRGATVVVGKVLLRLEEERPIESMGLQSAGHDESELTRCGTELMLRKVSGRSMAGSVGRGKWGGAWESCWGWEGHPGISVRLIELQVWDWIGRKMMIMHAHGV
jgi:hypothetical protein